MEDFDVRSDWVVNEREEIVTGLSMKEKKFFKDKKTSNAEVHNFTKGK